MEKIDRKDSGTRVVAYDSPGAARVHVGGVFFSALPFSLNGFAGPAHTTYLPPRCFPINCSFCDAVSSCACAAHLTRPLNLFFPFPVLASWLLATPALLSHVNPSVFAGLMSVGPNPTALVAAQSPTNHQGAYVVLTAALLYN